MACCTDIGTGTAANVIASLLKKVVQEVKLVISLPRTIRDMEGEVQDLNNLTRDINAELAQLQMNPKSVVKAWLDQVDGAIERSRSIGTQYEQQKNCVGWCPNYICRYRISRRIRVWQESVSQLKSRMPARGEYGDPTPTTQVLVQNPQSGFVANARRSEQTELVERWLTAEDSNIRRIGIIGMGGVGKTSLLDTINNSPKVKTSFDLIIKVTVSKTPLIVEMQNCVADRLKLKDFEKKSNVEERKDMLQSYLKNKKYLLLLDDMWAVDMWTSDELRDLGVSLDDTGFKILLTTRDKEVCARMNMQETITVEPLLEQEGWELFRRRAFENRNGNVPSEIEEVAREFAKECKGLPLAIIVVAAAMAPHTELYEWESALVQMKNVHETFYGLHAGVDKKLFKRLQWSYDVLQPAELKVCFIYFAAYPEDKEIEVREVIDMWISEGLVKGGGDSYLDDIGHSYIKQLADRCLIEVVENDRVGRIESVKIHDVLRDLAIRIAEKEQRCYFKAGQGVSQFPSQEEPFLQGCARMSLMNNALHSLPTTLRCSSLSVLLLGGNNAIKEVPGSFMNELPLLRVLDLSSTGIRSLPPSIGNLKHLSSLQLQRTPISELPESIGDLKELQFLNLYYCHRLRCLPERMRELKRLRALNVQNCERLKHLPRGISELVSLERLSMWESRIALDFEEEEEDADAEKNNACLKDRQSLNRLESLMQSLSMWVNDSEEEEEEADAERKNLCLKDMQSLSSLRVLKVRIKSAVKEGVIGKCSKMRHLWLDSVGQNYFSLLPQDMQAMKDLESFRLWRCDVERLPCWITQFRKLAYLDLRSCKQLKELPAELPCLRMLWIEGCSKLEALELGMGFPKLQQLNLNWLESLECVGPVGAASGSGGLGEGASPLPPMLNSLDVYDCPKLKRLRGRWDQLSHLKRIRGRREWWDAIQWDDPNIKTSLESKYVRLPTIPKWEI